MASLDYRLNPLFTIRECSSCGALYNKSCGCSKGGLIDKFVRDPNKTPDSSQRPPILCVKCGNPVEGPSCQGCALWRKKLKEVWFTTCHENGINQDLLNTSESSDDDTNVVNAPRKPFVMESFVNNALVSLVGKVLTLVIIVHRKFSNQEPCNQTIDELPQTLPSFDPTCHSEKENSLPYVSKPNFVDDSPNVFNPHPQPPIYSCEFCGNDARYGHYCTPQVPFIYPEPCYNQDFNFPHDFHDFQQQYLCCENYGGPHESFQCQPMNEDYYHEQNPCYDSNSFGFDQFQPPQYTINHPIFNAQNSLLNSQNEFLNSQNKLMEQMTSMCDMVGQFIQKKEEEKRIEEEQAAKDRYWKIPVCYDDDDDEESSIPLKDIIIAGLPPCVAITPVLFTKEPVDSLIMEDEHLDTIPETESDELIKSSVEDLVQIPSESEDSSEGECDLPPYDDSSKNHDLTFSNPLFDIDEDFTSSDESFSNDFSSSDDESFSDEDVPKEIYSNPLFDEEIISDKIDASIISSPKIDSLLEQFSGELAHIDLIPPGINEDNLDPEGDIHLVERLLYDHSSPRPPEELNSTKSFPPSHIPVEDSDPFMEEIDLFLASDESIPPGIDSDYSDSEGDNLFLERLLHDDPTPLPDIPSPTHVTFPFEDHHDLDFTCVVRVFLPFFTYPDKGLRGEIPQDHEDPCLFSILQSFGLRSFAYYGILNPDHDFPDFEDSRAHSFVYSFELHIPNFT
ncbi:hypothetical protein Tco_1554586 [Tanacetum coccineum]